MQIISNIALISINETVIIQLISFLIFLFIINRVMFRPLRGIIDERDTYLDNIERDIEEAGKEVERINARIEEQETAAIKSANRFKKEIMDSGALEAGSMLEKTRKEIDALKQETESEITDMLAEARQHIQAESKIVSTFIMEKILDRRLSQ